MIEALADIGASAAQQPIAPAHGPPPWHDDPVPMLDWDILGQPKPAVEPGSRVRPDHLSRCRFSISRSCTTAATRTASEASIEKTTRWRGRPTVGLVTLGLLNLTW